MTDTARVNHLMSRVVRDHEHLPKERSDVVRAFFRNSSIIVPQLDRSTAELAQDVVWDHGVTPKDAIHVASAIQSGVSRLDTFDAGVLRFVAQLVAGRFVPVGP
jgi:predicted nucleic acid-binding protein